MFKQFNITSQLTRCEENQRIETSQLQKLSHSHSKGGARPPFDLLNRVFRLLGGVFSSNNVCK